MMNDETSSTEKVAEEKVAEEKVTEEKVAEEKVAEEESSTTKRNKRCHARMSVVSRQQQKIDADVYMAKESIGEILQWITIEVLTARPTEPIEFIRELFKDESLDLDRIRGVNNAGISILRNTLSRENTKLRATVRYVFFFVLYYPIYCFVAIHTTTNPQNALTKEEEDELDHIPSSCND